MKGLTTLRIIAAMPFLFAGALASADPISGGSNDPLYIVSLADAGFDAAMTGMTGTDIDLRNSGYTQNGSGAGTINLEDGQYIDVTDANGNAPERHRRTSTDYRWWHGMDRHFLGTHTNTITLDFHNMNIVGFSFSISAVTSGYRAWVGASAVDSNGAPLASIARTSWFDGLADEGAKRIGVYVAGGSTACSSISQVVIDPVSTWGVGDMTFYTNPGCTTVPEPGPLALLGLGLFGMAAMRRRHVAVKRA